MASNPHSLVEKEDVARTLHVDKGEETTLESFSVRDFLKKGDNYTCAVAIVDVAYTCNGESLETSYVVKINPQMSAFPAEMMKTIFDREIGFYEEILPKLNKKLEDAGEEMLKFPKFFHSVKDSGRQVMYLENLHSSDYVMHSKQESLDEEHTLLVVKEISRLHAASYMLLNEAEFKSDKYGQFKRKYTYMQELFDSEDESSGKMMRQMFMRLLDSTSKLLGCLPDYEIEAKFLRESKVQLFADVVKAYKAQEPYIVITHGDSWTNNFLFRYTPDNKVVDCRILDFQHFRVGSGALDLNHLLFTSISSDSRKTNLRTILHHYHSSFAEILTQSDVPVPVSPLDLEKEFYAKHKYGLFMTCIKVPTLLMTSEDSVKIGDVKKAEKMEEIMKLKAGMMMKKGGNVEELMKMQGDLMIEKMKRSPLLKSRFLDSFDEFRELGAFNVENDPSHAR